jgi:hypothetical protein
MDLKVKRKNSRKKHKTAWVQAAFSVRRSGFMVSGR